MRNMIVILMGLSLWAISTAGAETVTFEDLSLNPESYYNGSDAAVSFASSNVEFNNFYDNGSPDHIGQCVWNVKNIPQNSSGQA